MHTTTAAWNTFVLGAMLWLCGNATAAGLGPMTVHSLLGQPLIADIELVIQDRRELERFSARIASMDAHRRANIPYAVAALGLKAAIQTHKDGRRFIRVESVQPVSEPAVKLLIELISPGGQTSREYSALFEPPEVQRR